MDYPKSMVLRYACAECWGMEVSADGQWVKWEDVEHLVPPDKKAPCGACSPGTVGELFGESASWKYCPYCGRTLIRRIE